jgi:hypothetical protein
MAFNPFHSFRKHQKVVFAALTIICMLTFVFSAGLGRGDFFSELERMFGGRGQIPEVANVYGKSVTTRDIVELRQSREMANTFMLAAVGEARGKVVREVKEKIPEFDDRYKGQFDQLLSSRNLALQFSANMAGPLRDFGRQFQSQYFSQLANFLRQLQTLEDKLKTDKKITDAEKVRRLGDVMQRDFWQMGQQDDLYASRGGLYFGGSTSIDGLVDFKIWERQADMLGIQLTAEDIKAAIKRETWDLLTPQETSDIQTRYLRLDRHTAQLLLPALIREFRVRLAQDALSGYDAGGLISPPAPITPYELWDYYVKNRTEVTVNVLPVPASHFTSQVTEKPTEEALHTLFEKFKDAEPAPESETPGFKVPRRVRVEWVEAISSGKYYQTKAHNALIAWTAFGATDPWTALASVDLGMKDFGSFAYERWNYFKAPSWGSLDYPLAFCTYKELNRPETGASIFGQVAAALATPGPIGNPEALLLPIVLGTQVDALARQQKALTPVIAEESRRRVPFAVAVFGAGSNTNPILGLAINQVAAEGVPQYLPVEITRDQLARKVERELAGELLDGDLTAFEKDLADVKNQTPAFVKREVERRGWKYGATSEPRDRFDIAKDKGLDQLQEAYSGKERMADQKSMRAFAEHLFQDRDPKVTLYKPAELRGRDAPMGDTEKFLYWKSVDLAPEVTTFEVARPRVEEAWRLDKARPLAKADAEKIAEKARPAKGDAVKNLNDAALALKEKVIDLPGIARLKVSLSAREMMGPRYEPYRDYLDKLPYAKGDFVDEVLEKLKQPGDVIVLSDRPEKTYYVVALAQRHGPSMYDFQQGQLLGSLVADRRREYREQVRLALRAQARLTINDKLRSDFDKGGSVED